MSSRADRPTRVHPTLADWIDLQVFLHRDEGLAHAARRRRDRAIGRELPAQGGQPVARLVAWVRALRRIDHRGAVEPPGVPAAEALRLASVALVLLGLALGASTALGAFAYRPQGRINVVAALGVLVGLPALLLGVALLHALPPTLRRGLPWLGCEPEGGGLLQPARLALRALPQKVREALEQAWGRTRGLGRVAGDVRRWTLLDISQSAGVGFQVGALATAVALGIFSDLAFGWSTTLDVDPAQVHRLTSLLSAPWARLWPEAQPPRELVEATRFFRIAAEPDPALPPARYGQWWPFVLMCQACYGLLPRLLFLAVARLALGRALRRAMLLSPGAREVLERLEAPLVEGTAAQSETGRPGVADAGADDAGGAEEPLPPRLVLLEWAEALAGSAAAEHLGAEIVGHHQAGGSLDPAQDAEALAESAAAARREGVALGLAVRGFEPPQEEVMDALTAARRLLGEGHALRVVPVGGDPTTHRAWRRRLRAVGDPWLAATRAVAAPPAPATRQALAP